MKLIPAQLNIVACDPNSDSLLWHLYFTEGTFDGENVVAWSREDREPRKFKNYLFMSIVYDPLPVFHDFLRRYASGEHDAELDLTINEEGQYATLKTRFVTEHLIEFHMRTEHRAAVPDVDWHFLLDTKDFVEQLSAAYCKFGVDGGWIAYEGVFDAYYVDELDEEDLAEVEKLQVDNG